MDQQLPYPEAEFRAEPRSIYDQFDEELQLYPDSESFRSNVRGLTMLYGERPFLRSMMKYTGILSLVKVGEENNAKPTLDAHFYSGCIVSTHIMLWPATPSIQRKVLSYDPMEEFNGTEDDLPAMEAIMTQLKEWDDTTYMNLFQAQEDEFQDRVRELTERIYGVNSQLPGADRSFMSGFMFASNMIWRVAKTNVGPPV